MAGVKPDDLFVSTEEEVEVDAETAAAIERGIKDADKGRTLSLDVVRIPEWISKFESRKRRIVGFEAVTWVPRCTATLPCGGSGSETAASSKSFTSDTARAAALDFS